MDTYFRHENKYIIDACQAAILEARAKAILKSDINADDKGSYLIKSLYFDNYDNESFYDTENGYDNRTKYRIRYYGSDTSFIKLEKKSKVHGMTHKESCRISIEQCKIFMQGQIPAINEGLPEKTHALFLDMYLKNLIPKVIVIYEREPFIYPIGNVRVTFDRNLASSNNLHLFLNKITTMRPIFQSGESLMEVKWDELLPDYIYDQLQLGSLQRTNFSKYYLCRRYNCLGGLRI